MAPTPQHEPTMEEILASIRKIISEDASAKTATPEEESAPPAPTVEEPTEERATESADSDVLELTEVVEEPVQDVPAPPVEDDIDFATDHELGGTTVPSEDVAQDDPFALPAEDPADIAAEPETEPVFATAEDETPPAGTEEGLFSDKSREALGDALSGIDQALDETPQEAPAEPIPTGGERELGAIILNAIREKVDPSVKSWLDDNRDDLFAHIKPIVREWLDETFPAVLADAVRDEVARAVKLRGLKR